MIQITFHKHFFFEEKSRTLFLSTHEASNTFQSICPTPRKNNLGRTSMYTIYGRCDNTLIFEKIQTVDHTFYNFLGAL